MTDYRAAATAVAFGNSTATAYNLTPTSGAGTPTLPVDIQAYSTQSEAATFTIGVMAEIAGSKVGVNPYSWCRSIEI
jgi:hypothetical protein